MMALLPALTLGAAITLGIWSLYQIFAAVPHQDRTYLDRPPLGFRLAWPLVQLLVHYLGPRLSRRYRLATQARLRRAGVDYSLSAEQFFAGKLLAALAAGLLALWVQRMLGTSGGVLLFVAALGGFYYPELWLKEAIQRRERAIFKALPFYLDIMTLSIEAGANLTGGFTQAVGKAPDGPLRGELSRVLRDVRAGKPRAEALRAMAERVQTPEINSLVSALIQAERVGSSLGPVLRAQADQRRSERFLKAEKLAMEAPVKLLGPLVMFIFPNTFLVLAFVLLVKAALAGVLSWPPLLWALSWPG